MDRRSAIKTGAGLSALVILIIIVILMVPSPKVPTINNHPSALTFSAITWGDNAVTISALNSGNSTVEAQQIYIQQASGAWTNFTAHSSLPLAVNAGENATIHVSFSYSTVVNYGFNITCSDGFLAFNGYASSVTTTSLLVGDIYWRENRIIFAVVNEGSVSLNITRLAVNSTDYTGETNLPMHLDAGEGGTVFLTGPYEYDASYTFTFTCSTGSIETSVSGPVSTFQVRAVIADTVNNWLELAVDTPRDGTVKQVELSFDNVTFVDVTANTTAVFDPALRAGTDNGFFIYFPNSRGTTVSPLATYYARFTMEDGSEYTASFSALLPD
jgi:hypothetical protein